MESKIDWSNAPEDADKYNTHNGMFYKGERPYLQVFIHEQWMPSAIMKSNELFVYRPTTPSWSGEGLPPVGVDLQWFSSVYGWIGGKVVAHDEQTTIVRHNDGYEGCYLHNLKPCKTTEQIAADARRKAIDEMVKALCMDEPGTAEYIRCGLIYDAGFRKQ